MVVLGILGNVGLVVGLVVALDPRLGGELTRWTLTVVSPSYPAVFPEGVEAPAGLLRAAPWASFTVTFILLQFLAVAQASRVLFLDRALPVLQAAPLRDYQLMTNRLVRLSGVMARNAWPLLAAVTWLALTAGSKHLSWVPEAVWSAIDPGPPAESAARLAAFAGGATAVPAAVLTGMALSLFTRVLELQRPSLGRLLALPLAVAGGTTCLLLFRLCASSADSGLLSPTRFGVTEALVLMGICLSGLALAVKHLGSGYRALLGPVATVSEGAGRSTWAPMWLRGPVGAVVARDVSLAWSNPVTYVRASMCVLIPLSYPVVRMKLGGTAEGVLLPGLLGLPLATACMVWILAVSELLVGLGKVDEEMADTILAAPHGVSGLRLGRMVSGFLIGGVLALLIATATLLAGGLGESSGDGKGAEVCLYFAVILGVALGQSALAAWSGRVEPLRRDSRSEELSGGEVADVAGGPGLLLEQVPLSTAALKLVGLLGFHLAACLVLPARVAVTGAGGLAVAKALVFAGTVLPGALAVVAVRRFPAP